MYRSNRESLLQSVATGIIGQTDGSGLSVGIHQDYNER